MMRILQTQKLERIVQPLAATFRNIPSTYEPNSPCMAYLDHKTFAALIPKIVAGYQVKCRMGNPQTPTQRCLNNNMISFPNWGDLVSPSVKSLNRVSQRECDLCPLARVSCSAIGRPFVKSSLNGSHGEFTETDDMKSKAQAQDERKRRNKEAKTSTHSATPDNGHKNSSKNKVAKDDTSLSTTLSSASPTERTKPEPRVFNFSIHDRRKEVADKRRALVTTQHKNTDNYDNLERKPEMVLVDKNGDEFEDCDDSDDAVWLEVYTECIARDDVITVSWGSYMEVDSHYTFGFTYSEELVARMFNAQLPPPIVISKSTVTRVFSEWLPSIGVSSACAVIPHFIPGTTPVMVAVGVCYSLYSRFGIPHDTKLSPQIAMEYTTTVRPEYGPPPPAWIRRGDEVALHRVNTYWSLANFKSRVSGPIYSILSKELFKQFGAESVTTYGLARMQKAAFEQARSIYTTHVDADVVINTIAFVACQMEVYRQQLATSVRRDQTVSGLGSLLAKVGF